MNRKFALACAAAAVLVVAAYANSLHNSFHFDDAHVIETNLYLRDLSNIPRFFTDAHTFSSLPQNATYRPLVTLSLALDYARGHGLDPAAFHQTQIALLVITGALLAAFFTPIAGEWLALLAATLFCVQTANTETMNLISARSELLSTIGLLASFVLYQRSPFARRTLLYLLPLAIGALAKAPLVVFAPLLFAYALLFEKQPPRKALRIATPPLLIGIALLAFLNSMNAKEWTSGAGSRLPYLITQPFAWLHYARLFFLPIGLTADTDWQPFAHWYDTRAVAGYLFVALLVLAIARARPAIAFGLAWFAVALLPTSLFPLAEVVNEHRIFFAYIGAVLALVIAIPPRARTAVMLALIVANTIGTIERNKVWRTEETLWADTVAKAPANGRAWMNYGLTQMAKGRYAVAKSCFERAALLTPNYSILEINRGVVEGALGDPASAEQHFRRALALNPDANAHFFFARWLVQRGRAAEGLLEVREAVRMSPAFAEADDLSRRLDVALGRRPGRAWPDYAGAFRDGRAAIDRGDWLAAAEANRDALRHDRHSADAWNNLGWSLAQLGLTNEAAHAYEQALAIEPSNDRVRNNLHLLGR